MLQGNSQNWLRFAVTQNIFFVVIVSFFIYICFTLRLILKHIQHLNFFFKNNVSVFFHSFFSGNFHRQILFKSLWLIRSSVLWFWMRTWKRNICASKSIENFGETTTKASKAYLVANHRFLSMFSSNLTTAQLSSPPTAIACWHMFIENL